MRRLWQNLVLLLLVGIAATAAFLAWPYLEERLLAAQDVSTLSRTVADNPANWRAQYWYGKRLAEAEQFEQSERALRICLGAAPDHRPAMVELAKVLLIRGNYQDAFQLLRAVTGRDPRQVEARLVLAALYRQRRAYPRAVEVAGEAIKIEPLNPRALYELGMAQFLLQKRAEAEQTLRKAADLEPENPQIALGLAELLLRGGRTNEAESWARQAVRAQPDAPNSLLMLAQVLSQKAGDPAAQAEAIKLADRTAVLDPTSPEALWIKATILSEQAAWADAIPLLEAVVRARPRRTQAHYLLSRAYASTGEKRKSEAAQAIFRKLTEHDDQAQDLERRIAAAPDSAALRFRLAEIHSAAGYTEEAIAAYRLGLELEPGNEVARTRMAELIQRGLER